MTALSPQYAGFSLTDELAEATNELLSLGGRELDGKAHESTLLATTSPPLPTPSPLNLSAGGGVTLSSLLEVSQSSRLVLIHDDEDNDNKSKKLVDKSNQQGVVPSNDASDSFDADDDLPSSQLNRLHVSVLSTSTTHPELAPSPRLRPEKEKATGMTISQSFDEERSPRTNHTPAFFTESFPESKGDGPPVISSGSKSKLDNIRTPTSLQLAISGPPQATLSSIGEASVIVKLHGNGRLERDAQDRMIAEQEQEQEMDHDVQYSSQRIKSHPEQYDDEDQSSLLSLAATAITTSSQASSKARRKVVRRRSAGSTSAVTEDLDTMEDVPFARDVQIRGFTVVGEKSRGFVCYDVRVITIRGTTISILRRFSSFCQLRQSLINERPQHASIIPSLPPRRTGLFQKYASHHLEKRRRALQKWLAVVMIDRRWATTKSLREWVVGSSDEM